MRLLADEPEPKYMLAGMYFEAINLKRRYSSQSHITGKLYNISDSECAQNLNACPTDTVYLFWKLYFCSNNVTDF